MNTNWFYDFLPEEIRISICLLAKHIQECEVKQFCTRYTVPKLVEFLWSFKQHKNQQLIIHIDGKPTRRTISRNLSRKHLIENIILYNVHEWVQQVFPPQKSKNNKPKYTNAYLIFCENNRQDIISENPNLINDFIGMQHKCSSLWSRFKLHNPSGILKLKLEADIRNHQNGLY